MDDPLVGKDRELEYSSDSLVKSSKTVSGSSNLLPTEEGLPKPPPASVGPSNLPPDYPSGSGGHRNILAIAIVIIFVFLVLFGGLAYLFLNELNKLPTQREELEDYLKNVKQDADQPSPAYDQAEELLERVEGYKRQYDYPDESRESKSTGAQVQKEFVIYPMKIRVNENSISPDGSLEVKTLITYVPNMVGEGNIHLALALKDNSKGVFINYLDEPLHFSVESKDTGSIHYFNHVAQFKLPRDLKPGSYSIRAIVSSKDFKLTGFLEEDQEFKITKNTWAGTEAQNAPVDQCQSTISPGECYTNLAIDSENVSYCDKILESNWKSMCYTLLAPKLKNISYCEKTNYNDRQKCYAKTIKKLDDPSECLKISNTKMRDSCLYDVSTLHGIDSYCGQISITEGMKSRDYCYRDVAKFNNDAHTCLNIADNTLSWDCISNIGDATACLGYDEARVMAQCLQNFRNRVGSSSSYCEPLDSKSEYSFCMGILKQDSDYCDDIDSRTMESYCNSYSNNYYH